jgi:hypothetical protein
MKNWKWFNHGLANFSKITMALQEICLDNENLCGIHARKIAETMASQRSTPGTGEPHQENWSSMQDNQQLFLLIWA